MEQPSSTSLSLPPSPTSSSIPLTPPSSQPYQPTIFISRCNSYLGSHLAQTFRNDHLIEVNPNLLVGTLHPSDQSPTPPDLEIISFDEKRQYNTALFNADLILFEIEGGEEGNRGEFEYILGVLKYMGLEKKKTVVLVSNFESWGEVPGEREAGAGDRNGGDDWLRELENRCAEIQKINPLIRGYVVTKGIVYGCGQSTLYPYFRSSILSSSAGLSILAPGTNHIPTIHILDLCSIIQHITSTLPQQKYHLASDGTNPTQSQILKSISDNLGEGITHDNLLEDVPLYEIPREFFLNLRVKKTKVQIEWHCGRGFVESIGEIVSEFNEARGIKTNKIFVGGMPVSGKTHIASILSKHYNLPHITIKETIELIKNHPSQLGSTIKKILEETRVKMIEQQQKIFEQNKKKKKPKKGEPVEEFDPSKVVPRLSEENLVKVYRARLAQQDCRNKGYVLDGFPKTAQQAGEIWKDAEESLPNSGFYIEATEEEVKERVKKMGQEGVKDSHWTDEATVRRLGAHKANTDGNRHILEFFKESKIDNKKLPFNQGEPKPDLISFVERNGSMGLTQADPVAETDSPTSQQNIAQQPEVDKGNEEEELTLESLKENERKILDEKSKPIRQYLIDNVIPQLTEGLIEICRQTPSNPLDFLIGFLEEKQGGQLI